MAKAPELSDDDKAFLDTPPADAPLDELKTGEDEGVGDHGQSSIGDDDALGKKPDAKAAEDKAAADKATADKDKKAKAPEDAKKQEMVPHGAMEAERQRRKRVERELATERQVANERNARLEERLSLINEALKPPAQPPPNPDDDIFAAYRHLEGELSEMRQNNQQRDQRQQEQDRQTAAVQQLTMAGRADAARFRTETPDFNDAYNYFLQSRHDELIIVGCDPVTIDNTIRQDEINIMDIALRKGDSPAEVFYNLARQRGYQPKTVQAEPPAIEQPSVEQQKPNGAEQVERLKQAKDASESLSQGGGGAGGGMKMDLNALDRMSEAEFSAFYSKLQKKDPHGYDKWMRAQMVGRS